MIAVRTWFGPVNLGHAQSLMSSAPHGDSCRMLPNARFSQCMRDEPRDIGDADVRRGQHQRFQLSEC